jgi:hypothetical protein
LKFIFEIFKELLELEAKHESDIDMKSKLIEELAANLEITVCWVFLKINFIQNNIFVEK